VLYTVTLNNLIKMNSLEAMGEINQLKIGTTGEIIRYQPTIEGEATEAQPPQ
jgi:hypothetical protein